MIEYKVQSNHASDPRTSLCHVCSLYGFTADVPRSLTTWVDFWLANTCWYLKCSDSAARNRNTLPMPPQGKKKKWRKKLEFLPGKFVSWSHSGCPSGRKTIVVFADKKEVLKEGKFATKQSNNAQLLARIGSGVAFHRQEDKRKVQLERPRASPLNHHWTDRPICLQGFTSRFLFFAGFHVTFPVPWHSCRAGSWAGAEMESILKGSGWLTRNNDSRLGLHDTPWHT